MQARKCRAASWAGAGAAEQHCPPPGCNAAHLAAPRACPKAGCVQATSNVDTQSDALIQDTVRSAFEGCTVLTIAHRLNTILSCDRILVLHAGAVAEFGPPQQLLQVSCVVLAARVAAGWQRGAPVLLPTAPAPSSPAAYVLQNPGGAFSALMAHARSHSL